MSSAGCCSVRWDPEFRHGRTVLKIPDSSLAVSQGTLDFVPRFGRHSEESELDLAAENAIVLYVNMKMLLKISF